MFDNDLGRGAMRYDYSKGGTKLTYELKYRINAGWRNGWGYQYQM